MKYILASASPRRSELLTQAGLVFDIIPSDIDEKITKSIPSDVVMELAEQKALSVFHRLEDKKVTVIGADTIVVYKDEILGKPLDEQESYDMLSLLSDRTHQVYTGVSLISGDPGDSSFPPSVRTFFEVTDVTLYPISRSDLRSYVETGDSLDKAGAYGIQGPFAIHIKQICGDYYNVVGLPIGRLHQELIRSSLHEY